MDFQNKGLFVSLDLPNQVEFNRRKNVEQDQRLSTLSSQVQQLIEQAPAGFLPRVYYGLTRGGNTYRFINDTVLNVELTNQATIGDAFEFYADNETAEYIPAVGILINETQIQIVIQGDYDVQETNFSIENMRTGEADSLTFENSPLSEQAASYLGDYPAEDNKEKQITVLYDVATGKQNLLFASIDINGDEVYNWLSLGGFLNGTDGTSIYSVTSSTITTVLNFAKTGDLLLAGDTFSYSGNSFNIGDLKTITLLSPLTLTSSGNIRGATGADGADGADGYTPYIQDNYWYINGVNTGVKAIGTAGTDGTDGQSFQTQSGLYSAPANWGETGNVDSEGNALLQLPTLPQTNITGKGYVVYDPLTTPLSPFYDLYFANNGDVSWTIIHPYSGLKGQDGTDGYTPYIQNNQWYINGVSTGVQATGDTGATGPAGPTGPTGPAGHAIFPVPDLDYLTYSFLNPINIVSRHVQQNDCIIAGSSFTYTNSIGSYNLVKGQIYSILSLSYDDSLNKWEMIPIELNMNILGPTGATPQIAASATGLSAGASPTVTVTGTTDNPILTFGIPAGAVGATFSYNNGVLTITTP